MKTIRTIAHAKDVVTQHRLLLELGEKIRDNAFEIRNDDGLFEDDYKDFKTQIWQRSLKQLYKAMQRGLAYYMGTMETKRGTWIHNNVVDSIENYLIKNKKFVILRYGKYDPD